LFMEESSVKSFDRRPTWLLHDINELMHERNGNLVFADLDSSNLLTKRPPADKSHLYKNYVREKTSTFKPGDIFLKSRESKRNMLTEGSEKNISNFVEKLRHERQRQREQREAFMRHAIDPPRINPIVKARSIQHRPLSADPSPLPLLKKMERPKTAPSHQQFSSGKTTISPSPNNGPNNGRERTTLKKSKGQKSRDQIEPGALSIPSTEDSLPKIQERILTLAKMVQFLKTLEHTLLSFKREQNGKAIFVTKIQRCFRNFILRRQAYHKAVMPSVFMRFLRTFQKRSAAKKILIFLREFSTIHSHLIVKRFMVCVRKAQIFIREMLRVKRARTQLIVLYWEKIEKNYRKQIEDQERETFARLQRERMARITTGSSSDVHDRWGMTHKQVVTLFGHMDTVDMRRANFLRESGSPSRSSPLRHNSMSANSLTSTVLSDRVDAGDRQRIIEKYVSYKRGLHLKKGAVMSPHVSRPSSPHAQPMEGSSDPCAFQPFACDALNIRLIKKFIHEPSAHSHHLGLGSKCDEEMVKTNRELLERQLAPAGVLVEDDHGMGRKRKAAMRLFRRKPFLCLTDPGLGKPWKQIIEEVVREDILRRKRILQEKNRKTFQDRVAEEQKRGIPIPTFTPSTQRRGTDHAPAVSGLANRVRDALADVETTFGRHQTDRGDEDAPSPSTSPRSSCSRRGRNDYQLSASSSSPALSRDYSRTGEASSRFPVL
jgi:hypothetical protein